MTAHLVTGHPVVPLSVLALIGLVTLTAACGGKTSGTPGGETTPDGGQTLDASPQEDGSAGHDGGSGSMCLDLPAPTASDLACDTDRDCTWVWAGSVCYGECNCAGGPGNTAYQARTQTAIYSILSGPGGCACPAPGLARCVARQCAICSFGPDQPAECDDDGGAGGDTGTGESDSGTTTGDSGTFVNDAGQTCVDVDIATYDTSCSEDSDCTTIQSGTVCDGSCGCDGHAINVSGESRYEAAVSDIVFAECPCPAQQSPVCGSGQCFIPTP